MLLLETVRGRQERREDAWRERQRLFPLATFPSPADQLLTLVAAERNEEDVDRQHMSGMLKTSWVLNQAKLAAARELGEDLLWLGDLALLLQCYAHVGQRPIRGLEAWVPPERMRAISAELRRKNFVEMGRSAETAFYHCPDSDLSLRLLSRLLPIRQNPRSIPSRTVDGYRVLAPELLAIRQCLARPHSAWWVADLVSLFPKLEATELKLQAQETRSSLAVARTLRRTNRLGLEPIGSDFRVGRIYPGEWFEPLLGHSRLASSLLLIDRWRDLPGALLKALQPGQAHPNKNART